MQHTRMVSARVLTKDEDCIGPIKILQVYRAFSDADAALQSGTARLMAHVGAVGEIIGSNHAAKQLINIGRFVAGAPGGIQLHPIRVIHRLDMLRNQRPDRVPANRLIAVGSRVIAQRLGEAPLILKEVVRLLVKGANGVAGEEVGVNLATGGLPGHGLSPVFTEAEGAFIIIAPGAAGAVKATGLVHAQQIAHILQGVFAVDDEAGRRFQRAKPAGSGVVWLDGGFKFHAFFQTAGCCGQGYTSSQQPIINNAFLSHN